MKPEKVLNEFKKAGALLEGHFILASGLHSDLYLQKSLIFTNAKTTAKLMKALAKKVRAQVKTPFSAIVSTALGGIVPGYEMGRQLGLPAFFVERVDGEFQLRRNFTLTKGQPVLIVDDIVSTGTSIKECLAAVRKAGGKPVAVAALVDRTGGKLKLGVPFIPLTAWKVEAWKADKLPPHLKNIPAVKPGTRVLK
ncbi:MAG: orotate phosphoribosyltransferase [Alphaproteobacteria bacterium]|nr:orotate phosphoribosyltransferase [Alphaproteobacteria bacterium]